MSDKLIARLQRPANVRQTDFNARPTSDKLIARLQRPANVRQTDFNPDISSYIDP